MDSLLMGVGGCPWGWVSWQGADTQVSPAASTPSHGPCNIFCIFFL